MHPHISNYSDFGEKLRLFRMRSGKTINETARNLGIDRTYLSRLENGHERPSNLLLNKLISHLNLSEVEAIELSNLAGYQGEGLVVGRKEVKSMDQNIVKGENTTQMQVNVSDKTPILYTDAVFLNSNQYGVVFNITQSIAPNQQVVVARFGMSREHAKALLEVLGKHLAITTVGGKKQ